MKQYPDFHVSLKIFLRKSNEVLFLHCGKRHACGVITHWDWPGGRINENEQKIPLQEVIKREIKEELGGKIRYRIGPLAFQFRRYNQRKDHWVFINVYEANYISGDIQISDEHSGYEWVHLKSIRKSIKWNKRYFCNQEMYRALREYLKNIK